MLSDLLLNSIATFGFTEWSIQILLRLNYYRLYQHLCWDWLLNLNFCFFFSFPARKPFQCRYCPYSASQKGNLKTHVLCVHRKPFDNSLYPDRRLRRSHTPQRPSRLPPSITGDNRAPVRDQIGTASLCGTWCCHGNSRHRQLWLLF